MKATAFEFHYRVWISLLLYVLGFAAPWDLVLHLDGSGPNAHVWGRLAVMMSRGGTIGIASAFNLILIMAIVCAFLGAWLRTWGAAYLGYSVVHDASMRSDSVVADGPYRYVRNPLYLGTWANTVALAILMPPSGAIFTLIAIVLFQVRLILGEEAHLNASIGDLYRAYFARVPRLLPALLPRVAAGGVKPRWVQAAVAEIFMWGSTASFAALGWRYNAELLIQCMIVWFGVAIILRAFLGNKATA